MHAFGWFLIIAGVVIFLTFPWNAFWEDVRRSKSQKLAMERKLRKFEAEQRVRQQAAVMQRTREINALAHRTCQAMVQAAMEAQRQELNKLND